MKKTYMTPDTQVIKMAINQHLLTGSPNGETNGLDPTEPPVNPDVISSRGGRGFWDDEEDY